MKAYLLLLLVLPSAYAGPKWSAEPPKRVGNHLLVTCRSDGPDDTTALIGAMNECRSIAAASIANKYDIKTVSVQTESSAQLHEEVSSAATFTGLECTVLDSHQEGSSRWLKCSFDLSKITSVDTPPLKSFAVIASDTREVVLSFVPKCDSLIVVGKPGRTITCLGNPISVITKPGDSEIIVRREGYMPKHVPITQTDSSAVVYLDRN